MNADLIGILYIVGMLLFWGSIFGLIFLVVKFLKRKSEHNKQVLHKLDEIILLLKEKDQLNKLCKKGGR
ncbi:MAG: hypothetical protein FH756_17435 [Firmicutes bacterium]|nr:hypothetical protein [Bacillota bacterium]